jgi:hypothetical protein
MPLLRIFRNLSVLVILSVGALTLIPRPVAAQSSCHPLGGGCGGLSVKCCFGLICSSHGTCCSKPFHGMSCTSYVQCCSGDCYIKPGQSLGECL